MRFLPTDFLLLVCHNHSSLVEFLSSSIPERVCVSRIWNPLKNLPEEDKRAGNHRGNATSELVSFVSNKGHLIQMYRILFENLQKSFLSPKGDPLWEKSTVPGLCGACLCRTPRERPVPSLRLWAAVFSHSTTRQCVRVTSPPGNGSQAHPFLLHIPQSWSHMLPIFLDYLGRLKTFWKEMVSFLQLR